MTPALLIIDLQNDFFQNGRLAEHRKLLTQATNELVDMAREQDIPIIWVHQEYKADLSDAPLYNRKHQKSLTIENTDGSKWLLELHKKDTDHTILKKRYSAFFQTNLDTLLEKLKVNTLIVAGINTMTCIRTTCIDAYQRDYEVILALDAVDAYDIEQHENSLKYLQYAVATGMQNDEILTKIFK